MIEALAVWILGKNLASGVLFVLVIGGATAVISAVVAQAIAWDDERREQRYRAKNR